MPGSARWRQAAAAAAPELGSEPAGLAAYRRAARLHLRAHSFSVRSPHSKRRRDRQRATQALECTVPSCER